MTRHRSYALIVQAISVSLIFGLGEFASGQARPFPGNSLENKAAATPAAPTGQPEARKPGDPADRLCNYLDQEYRLAMTKAKDRTARSLILIGEARIPRPIATKMLLEGLRREIDPVVRMVAWQCLLSRAKYLSAEEYKQWMECTQSLVRQRMFNGALRAPLLQIMACSPPDRNLKEMFAEIFMNTNSTVAADAPVLEALGECARKWQSPDVIEFLLNRMATLDHAYRAERVLRAAGSTAEAWIDEKREAGSDVALKHGLDSQMAWWQKTRSSWKAITAVEGEPWRNLSPQFVPAVSFDGEINVNDPSWRRDLELRPPNLRSFDVAFVVDATGSMGPVLAWLRHDVKRLMKVFGQVCLEPRIALTFYRDHGDAFVAVTQPLTGRLEPLIAALDEMKAKGGGDVPEAVLDGLNDSLTRNIWSIGDSNRRVMVLIGDAPPHEKDRAKCEELVKKAAAGRGLRLYAIKAQTGYGSPEVSHFDTLAQLGNGTSTWLDWGQDAEMSAGKQVVNQVLIDAINSNYKDRIQPYVDIIWEAVADGVPETRKPWQPIVRRPPPPPHEHGHGPGERRPSDPVRPPPKPFDPQER